MPLAISGELFKVLDGHGGANRLQCLFRHFAHHLKETENLLKVVFLENEHHAAGADAIDKVVKEKHRLGDAVIDTIAEHHGEKA